MGVILEILATGVDNMLIDNLKIDTNRDGMDIDACQNVRITNCSVNSPWDDGICLKASYGLGKIRACQNITISDCYLAGNFDEGTLLDGTFKRSEPEYQSYKTGRIKLGTESNGDFKNIAITNCVFDECRGLAIESVDGSHIEDIVISNLTMRNVANSPLFIRLGNRSRGPDKPPVGSIRRISINNMVVYNATKNNAVSISGIPDHSIEDIQLSNIRINYEGGGNPEDMKLLPPENETKYPEPGMFGPLPCYGVFIRHAKAIQMSHIKLDYTNNESRAAFALIDVQDAYFDHINAKTGDGLLFDLRDVADFSLRDSHSNKNRKFHKLKKRKKL